MRSLLVLATGNVAAVVLEIAVGVTPWMVAFNALVAGLLLGAAGTNRWGPA